MVYKWYFSCQLGDGLCHRSHLLREPETTIDEDKTPVWEICCFPLEHFRLPPRFWYPPTDAVEEQGFSALPPPVLITETGDVKIKHQFLVAKKVMFQSP